MDNLPTKYYHGGPDGFHVGGWILPADETGAKTFGPQVAAEKGVPETVRTDRVYVTPLMACALMFASGHRRPMIYEVEPEDVVEVDPDYHGDPHESGMCLRARIVARHPVRPSDVEQVRRVIFGLGASHA